MKNKMLSLLVVIMVLACALAFAENIEAPPNADTTITTSCFRNAELQANTTANITIFKSNGNIEVAETAMANNGNGTHSFTHNFTTIGGYYTKEACNFGDIIADASTTINVFETTTCDLSGLFEINQTTQAHTTILQDIWSYLTGFLNNTITQINDTTTNNSDKLDQLISLESNETETNFTAVPTYIITNSSDCLTGSQWTIQAIVENQFGVAMTKPPLTDCFINSSLFPYHAMTYSNGVFTYSTTCPQAQTWNWTINCN
jgi:hypothetical protein